MSDLPFGSGSGGSGSGGSGSRGSGSGGAGSGGSDSGYGGFPGLPGFPGMGGGDGEMDLGAMFQMLGRALSWQGGPVNWDLAEEFAAEAVATADPPVTPADRTRVADAMRLADLWLDPHTTLPCGVSGEGQAWTRREWLTVTRPVWRRLCDTVAARVVDAMGQSLNSGLAALGDPETAAELGLPGGLPPELAEQLLAGAGPLVGMLGRVGGMLFGAQVGRGLGELATEVVSVSEVGIPLAAAGTAALLPTNVAAFGAGLQLPADEVRLYLALREAAHQRLFTHVGWLGNHLLMAVEDYARGISVDPEVIGRAMRSVDPADPQSLQRALGEGLFDTEPTAAQQRALARLETLLTLVEGWVDEVVDAAAAAKLPAAAALRETVRRRRAAGGAAEQTFATLVGLELRPRRLREAAALWQELATRRGIDGRDAIWRHPDLLPASDDLDDPATFAAGSPTLDLASLADPPATAPPAADSADSAANPDRDPPSDPDAGIPANG